jgi:hypothetical protein
MHNVRSQSDTTSRLKQGLSLRLGLKTWKLQTWETLTKYRDRCAIVSRNSPSTVAKENMPQSTAAVSTHKHPEATRAILVLGYANDRGEGCRALGY